MALQIASFYSEDWGNPTDRWQNQALCCSKEHWEDLFSLLCRSTAFLFGEKPKTEYTLLNSLNTERYWSRENLYCKTSLRNFFLNRIKRRLVWKGISHEKCAGLRVQWAMNKPHSKLWEQCIEHLVTITLDSCLQSLTGWTERKHKVQ